MLLYVACLLAGAGVLVVQLAIGHDGGADGGHDVHHGDAGHDLNLLSVVASVRFWAFALLAFGLVGTLLSAFGLAGAIATALVASISGIASGLFAVITIRRLLTRSPQSLASRDDVVGKMGRVVVAIGEGTRGKVRVELRGTQVDVAAHAACAIEEGERVIVEEVAAGEARVSRAPKELRE